MSRPACISAVWRDCANGHAIVEFSDGSLYEYTASTAAEVFRQILGASVIGRAFNRGVRLPPGGAFNIVGGIPGGFTLIYSNPPYRGAIPGPCGATPPFTWSVLSQSPPSNYSVSGLSGSLQITQLGSSAGLIDIGSTGKVFAASTTVTIHTTMDHTGQGQAVEGNFTDGGSNGGSLVSVHSTDTAVFTVPAGTYRFEMSLDGPSTFPTVTTNATVTFTLS